MLTILSTFSKKIFMGRSLFLPAFICLASIGKSQKNEKPISVIAYYAGSPTMIDSFKVEQLTHLSISL
jgi:hypothetical protein